MQKTIIADTSCIILLDKIEETDILRILYGEVIITSVIAAEFGKPLPSWISIKDAVDNKYEHILETSLDKGEASAIALALEQDNCLLILDDLRARKLAGELQLKYTGTIGLLVEAKLSGHLKSIRPVIDKIKKTNFRFTPDLERKILERAGE
jgi:predicted nucleic acid-binding protein